MKKILSLAMVLAFAATAALALQEPPANPPVNDPQPVANQPAGSNFEGTIATLDTGARTLTLRDADGKVTTYYWNDTTKLSADLKVGDKVTIVATDQSGRMTATSITVTTTTTTTKKTKY